MGALISLFKALKTRPTDPIADESVVIADALVLLSIISFPHAEQKRIVIPAHQTASSATPPLVQNRPKLKKLLFSIAPGTGAAAAAVLLG